MCHLTRRPTTWPTGEPASTGSASRRLTKRELLAYEEGKVNHYVVTNNVEVSNAYFHWCDGPPPIPFIRVRLRKRYAEVSADLITVPEDRSLWPAAREAIRRLFERESSPPYRHGVGIFSRCDRIPLERAQAVAAELWAILTAPRPQAQGD
jgi:hypothetical protein